MEYDISLMEVEDWPQVEEIYRQGIETGDSTFESKTPSWEQWNTAHLPFCRLVARAHEGIYGWAALSPYSTRKVYAGVAEVSIYVRAGYQGKKIGTALLTKLIDLSEEKGIWTLQAGIFSENEASLFLHKKCGFRVVGFREKIGRMKSGEWRDVILMERRSPRSDRSLTLEFNGSGV